LPITIATEVVNTVTSAIVASIGSAGGTVFTLTTGLYLLDYEMSFNQGSAVAIYRGPNAGALTIDNNTIAGSATATTWIHGRAFVDVVATSEVVAICPCVGSPTIVLAGGSTAYMVRLTILKIS